MQAIGFNLKNETTLDALSREIIKSSEIEGEILNREQVCSSVAHRLNIEFKGQNASSRYIDGVTEMMLDATRNYAASLTRERLFAWLAALLRPDTAAFTKSMSAHFEVIKTDACKWCLPDAIAKPFTSRCRKPHNSKNKVPSS